MGRWSSESQKTERRALGGGAFRLTPAMAANFDREFTGAHPVGQWLTPVFAGKVGERFESDRGRWDTSAVAWVPVAAFMAGRFDATPDA